MSLAATRIELAAPPSVSDLTAYPSELGMPRNSAKIGVFKGFFAASMLLHNNVVPNLRSTFLLVLFPAC